MLDASAVLALLLDEPGAAVVQGRLRTAVIGAANLAEVLTKLSDKGLPPAEALRAVSLLGLDVRPMTEAQAQRSAELRPLTRNVGLSLGDRACLALAGALGATALTADRKWGGIGAATGVAIELIR